jgi:FKBP-type peptidyl-prolyl cis-trans isomerase SlpA
VFLLEPDQAFGPHNPQLTQRMARSALPPNARPELHGLIEFTAPSGDKFTGIVRELDAEAVLVDFNHPLAGKPVRFEVEIIGIL